MRVARYRTVCACDRAPTLGRGHTRMLVWACGPMPMVEAAHHPLDLTHQAVALHLVHALALLPDQAVVVVAEARRDRHRTHRHRRLCRQGWA